MNSTGWARHRASSTLAVAATFAVLAACGGGGGGGGGGGTTNNTVPSPVLTSVSVNPTSVPGTTSATGTATLSIGAPSGGTTVTLQASPASAGSVPGNVLVSSGATTANFLVTTNDVSSAQTLTITATLDAVSKQAPLSVTIAPITARFFVSPDAGTQANAGQCTVVDSGDAVNRNMLQCTFDAGTSVPQSGISTYRWTLPGLTSPVQTNTPQLKDPKVGCGAGLNTVNVQLPVSLTVSGSAGTSSIGPVMVLFTKAGPC